MGTVEFQGNEKDILERMKATEVIVSDFDGTDVKPLLQMAAVRYLLNPKHLIQHPPLVLWSAKALPKRLIQGRDADSVLWSDLNSILGDDIKDIAENVRKNLYKNGTPREAVKKFLFPGVQEFYAQFPSTKKQYVSRNFEEILNIFGNVLGFDEIHATEDKARALEEIITSNNFQHYVVRGDSHSDDDVIDVAEFYKKKGVIDDYVAIAVGNGSHTKYNHVDVITPTNQHELADIIAGKKPRSAYQLEAMTELYKEADLDC